MEIAVKKYSNPGYAQNLNLKCNFLRSKQKVYNYWNFDNYAIYIVSIDALDFLYL